MKALLGSTTLRLAAAHLAATFLSTALTLSIIERTTTRLLNEEARRIIETEARGFAEIHALGGKTALAAAVARRISDPLIVDRVYLFTEPSGHRIVGNLRSWPRAAEIAETSAWNPVVLSLFRTDLKREARIDALSVRFPDDTLLLIGLDAYAQGRSREALGGALLIGLAISTIAAVATGWALMRMLLHRIEGFSVTARRIMSGDRKSRVAVEARGDEFDRLAETMNAMFDQIERQVDELRFVTDSIAHDLRSPLTRLRLHLSKVADAPEAAQALAEAERIERLLAALLDIARARAGVGRDNIAPMDLAAFAADLVELFEPVAEEKEIELRLDAPSPAPIMGHKELVFLAGSNLLDNAIRHAPPRSRVVVSALIAEGAPELVVADDGRGMDAARREEANARLNRRRGEAASGVEARAPDESHRLGLTLVAAVAQLHEAALTLEDNAPGLRARLTFPAPTAGDGAQRAESSDREIASVKG